MTHPRFRRRVAAGTIAGLLLSLVAQAPLGIPVAHAADGSGTAAISPSTTTVGTTGVTFGLTYTASEALTDGGVRFTIPAGWSAPTSSVGVGGRVTATSTGTIGIVQNVLDTTTGWNSSGIAAVSFTADAGVKQQGAASLRTNVGISIGSARFYESFGAATQDWSGYTKAGFWFRSTAAFSLGGLTFKVSESNNLPANGTTVTYNMPAVAANTWTYVTIDLTAFATSTRNAVLSYGFEIPALGLLTSFYADNLMLGPALPAISGQTVEAPLMGLASGGTVSLTYGAGGGTSGVTVPNVATTTAFGVASRVFSGGTYASIASPPTVTVSPGPPAALSLTTTPTSTSAGLPAGPAVVTVLDAQGNVATAATTSVTLGITTGALSGTTTVSASAGVATFPSFSVTPAGTGAAFTASAPGLPGITASSTLTVFGVMVAESASSTSVIRGGATDSFTLALSAQPSAPVTVTLINDGLVGLSTSSVTFGTGDWNVPRTVTVSATTTGSGAATSSVTFVSASTDLRFAGVTIAPLSVGVSGTAPLASALSLTQLPASVGVGLALSPTLQATVLDQFGAAFAGATTSVTLGIVSGPSGGTLTGTATVSAVAGIASFPGVALTRPGAYVLSVAGSGLTTATTSITAAGALVTESGGTTAVVEDGSGDSFTVALTALPALPVTVTVTSSAALSLSMTTLVFTAATGTTPQTITVTAPDDGAPGSAASGTVSFSVSSGDARFGGGLVPPLSVGITAAVSVGTRLSLTPPASVSAGLAIPAIGVSVLDQYGLLASTTTSTVTIALGSGPAAVLSGTTTVPAVAGVASFAGLSVTPAGVGYSLTVTSPGLTATTTPVFSVLGALVAESASSTIVVRGGASDSFTVALNALPSSTVTVTLSAGAGLTLSSSTLSFTTGNGTSPQTVTVSSDGTGSGTVTSSVSLSASSADVRFSGIAIPSVPVTIVAAASTATSLSLTSAPTSTGVGIALSPAFQATVLDQYGVAFPTSTASVSLAVTAAPASGLLSGTTTVFASGGVASFPNLSVNVPGSYTVVASASGLSSATTTFAAVGAVATQSGGTTAVTENGPGDAISVVLSAPPTADVTVAVSKTSALAISTTSLTFTAATWSAPQAIVVTAPDDGTSGSAASGTVSFALASSDLRFNAGLLPPIPVTIAATGTVASSVGLSLPASVSAGKVMTPFSVTILDQYGQAMTGATTSVTVSLASGPGGAALSGTTTVPAVNGVASFANLSVAPAGPNYSFTVSVPGLPATTTPAFTALGALVAESGGTTAVIRGGAGDTFTVALNALPSSAVAVSLSTGAGLSLSTTTLSFTTGNGTTPQAVAVSSDGTGSRTATSSVTLSATSADARFGGITIPPVTVLITDAASTATLLSFSQAPTSTGVGLALSPAFQVTVLDQYGAPFATSTASVTLAVTAGPAGGVLTGTTTVAASGGAASFPNLSVNVPGSYAVSASAAGLSGATASFSALGVVVSQSGGTTVVDEGGPGDTISIALSAQPSATASVSVTPSASLAVSSGTLAFTTGDWNVPRTVTVTAPEDGQPGSAATGTVSFSVASADARLDGGFVPPVAVTIGASASVPGSLALSPLPTVSAGIAMGPVSVTLRDQFGQAMTGATTTVAVSLTGGPAGSALAGTTTVPAASGVATFTGLTLSPAGSDYSLTFIAADFPSTSTPSFAVLGAIVTESASSTSVVRSGAGDSFSVVLNAAPTSTVAVSLAAGSGLSVSTTTLSFTAGDWSSPQTVTVSSDGTGSGNVTSLVTFSVSSADARFDGVTVPPVIVSILAAPSSDAALAITQAPLSAGANVAFSPTLQVSVLDQFGQVSSSSAANVSLSVLSGPSGGALAGTTTVMASAGVAAFPGASLSLPGTYVLQASAPGLSSATTSIAVVGVLVTEPGGGTAVVTGGAGDTVSIVLSAEPTAPVSVTATPGAGLGVSGSPVTFATSTWSVPQAVSVSGSASTSGTSSVSFAASSTDGRFLGPIADVLVTITSSSSGPGPGTSTPPVPAGVAIAQQPVSARAGATLGPIVVALLDGNGATTTDDGIAVALSFTPSTSVSGSLTASSSDGVATFASISVAAPGTYAVHASAFGVAGTATSSPIAIKGALVTETGGGTTVVAGGAGDSFSVVLGAQPSDDVTVSLDAEDPLLLDDDSLVFTPGSWDAPQSVAVTATGTAAGSAGISFSLSSDDADYDGAPLGDVTVTVLASSSTSTPGVASVIAFADQPATSSAGRALDPFTVTLVDADGNVVTDDGIAVTIGLEDGADFSGTGTRETFGGVATFDDIVIDLAGTGYVVVASSAGLGDVSSDPFAVAGVMLRETDGGTAVTEGVGPDAYGLRLSVQPSDPVTVTMSAEAGISLSDTTVTFAPGSWGTERLVWVTAVDDGVVNGTRTARIEHAVASDDDDFDGTLVPDVEVTISDNDVASPGNGNSGGSGSGGGGGSSGSSRRAPPRSRSASGGTATTTPILSAPPATTTSPVEIAAAPCVPYLTQYIRLGAQNDPDEVRKLQAFLIVHEGETGVQVTGAYDQASFDAVLRFQEKYNGVLSAWGISAPTGYVYTQTLARINELQCGMTRDDCPFFTQPVSLGDSGPEVAKVQGFLVSEGHMPSAGTGYFGPVTEAGVRAFQAKWSAQILAPLGLATPTGTWGPMTMKAAHGVLGCQVP